LEKTEGSIRNEQSRDTVNIGHKTQNEDFKKAHTAEKPERGEQQEPHQKRELS